MKGIKRRGWQMCLLVPLAAAVTLVVGDFARRTRVKGRMPRIATADTYLVAVESDGSLWAMGRNLGGVSIGDGTPSAHSQLVRIGKDKDWVDVANGGGFSLALKSDGSLWA